MSTDVTRTQAVSKETASQAMLSPERLELLKLYILWRHGYDVQPVSREDGVVILENEFGEEVAEVHPDGTVHDCEVCEEFHVDDVEDVMQAEAEVSDEDIAWVTEYIDELLNQNSKSKPDTATQIQSSAKQHGDSEKYVKDLIDSEDYETIKDLIDSEDVEVDVEQEQAMAEAADSSDGIGASSPEGLGEPTPPPTEPEGAMVGNAMPTPAQAGGLDVARAEFGVADMMDVKDFIETPEDAIAAQKIVSNPGAQDALEGSAESASQVFEASAERLGVVEEDDGARGRAIGAPQSNQFIPESDVEESVSVSDDEGAPSKIEGFSKRGRGSERAKGKDALPQFASSAGGQKASDPFSAGAKALHDTNSDPAAIALAHANKGGPPYFIQNFSSPIAAAVNLGDADSHDHVGAAHSSEGHDQSDREGGEGDGQTDDPYAEEEAEEDLA